MDCWFCKGKLVWNCDYSFEDFGLDGEGIVAVLTCSDCEAVFNGHLNLNEEEE